MILKAKIKGIIPAELTLKGRCVAPDWRYILPWRNTLLPYCTGTLRCASLKITMMKINAMEKSINTSNPPVLSLAIKPWPNKPGSVATIPPKIIREIPEGNARLIFYAANSRGKWPLLPGEK